jgi:hypothetical protein
LDWPETLNRFINHFQHLETLSLSFECSIDFKSFQVISGVLYLPYLQILKLSGVECTEEDLIRLFQSHRKTLQDIALDAISLIREGGSWHSIFVRIGDQLNLQLTRLYLADCTEDERDIDFLEVDAAPAYLVLDTATSDA